MAKECETCVHKSDFKAIECGTCMVGYIDGVQQSKPSNYKAKPKTNADRIRSMTDEELAEFIRDVSHECEDAHWGSKCQCCDFPWCSSDCTLAWLQQPAEEGIK